MDITVKHDDSKSLFYAEVSGNTAELNYRKKNENTLDYYRTYVPASLRGQGIASQITRKALDYARENNFKIIPTCSYVKNYIDHHPDDADLVKS